MKKFSPLLFVLLCLPVLVTANPFSELYYYRAVESGPAKILECDLAVYGGTPAGVATAIQAAKMGKKVLFFSFNHFVGGLTSGGLTSTDVGTKKSIPSSWADCNQVASRGDIITSRTLTCRDRLF